MIPEGVSRRLRTNHAKDAEHRGSFINCVTVNLSGVSAGENMDAKLNAAGANGGELVGFTINHEFVFKRPSKITH